ncbi:MAG: 50S ribosomal protein L13 [Candidatus Omnitrophica bacterium]|nr:50S ribosomal protein L13 [Candidatus Omnitrophota bacterium]
MTTTFVRTEDITRRTHLIDANGKVLGRLATRVATLLMGKDRADYTPHADPGDAVIIINAEKIRLTGKKEEEKIYKRFTGYPGGLKEFPFKMLRERHPDEIILHAVKGMLPNNKLTKRMLGRLWVYRGPNHPHAAQKPVPLSV